MNSFISTSIRFSFFLCLCSSLCVLGCKGDAQSTDDGGSKATKVVGDENPSKTSDESKPPAKAESSKPTKTKFAKWAGKDQLIVKCDGEKIDLAEPIGEIAKNIELDSLDYNLEPFTDCSGIFHRVLDSLKVRCPKQKYPPKTYRSTRDLGKWYFEQDQFVRITDPLNMSAYIKPGAVMLYGGRGISPDSLSTEDLFVPGGISHMGVVISVKKEKDGVIAGYSLFHGQRPGKKASITHYHRRSYRNRTNYPTYGNGTQPWVGVAPIIQEK